MQSKQVALERLHTGLRTYKVTSNPTNTTRKPHASLDNIQLFTNFKTRNSYLIN